MARAIPRIISLVLNPQNAFCSFQLFSALPLPKEIPKLFDILGTQAA
jgi:hypothetical protein